MEGPSLRTVAVVVVLLIVASFVGGLTGHTRPARQHLTECQAIWWMLEEAAPSAFVVDRCP